MSSDEELLTPPSHGADLRLRNGPQFAEDSTPTDNHGEATAEEPWLETRANKARILVGFWILGLCNNFGYVVMLSAAYDILQPKETMERCKENATIFMPHKLICNAAGTGNVLLADILPTLFIKFTAPFYMHKISYNVRMILVVVFNCGSFLLVAFAGSQVRWLSYLGIVSASFSSGFGEIVMLSLSSYYTSRTILTWSSGTGAAGIIGAVTYSGLTQLGLSPKNTLFCMLIVPALQAFSYFWLVVKPDNVHSSWSLCSYNKAPDYNPLNGDDEALDRDERADLREVDVNPRRRKNDYTFPQMVQLVKPLLKFMIPLMVVYLAEYFINQALFELLYFTSTCSWMSIESQYRWFQTIYQVGVFLSRSSLLCFKFKLLWILPLLQLGNVAILLSQVLLHYIPDKEYGIWIVFALILFEGSLGGMGYVHTFYQISQQVQAEHKEFSMGVASVADTTGVAASAFVSILAHNQICKSGVTW